MNVFYKLPTDIQRKIFIYFQNPTAKIIKNRRKDILLNELNYFFKEWKWHHESRCCFPCHLANAQEALSHQKTTAERWGEDEPQISPIVWEWPLPYIKGKSEGLLFIKIKKVKKTLGK